MQAEDITGNARDQGAELETGQGSGKDGSRPAGPEQRAHPRFDVDEEASLLLVSHDSWHPCRVLDLSVEGCRVSTGDEFRAGIRKHVEISFKVHGIAFRLSGTTQWTDHQHAVGIRFTYPTSRRREELAEVLREVDAANSARAVQEADRELTEREAALESSGESSNLVAGGLEEADPLEGAVIQAAIPEEPLARIAVLPALLRPTLPHGNERRVHERHSVDSTASIFLIHSGYPVNGWILNLSEGGCGIRTEEPFQLGIYTRVETEFHLNGVPFRLSGVIQFIYERNLVGVRFLDISNAMRERVKMLIAELEEELPTKDRCDQAAQSRGAEAQS